MRIPPSTRRPLRKLSKLLLLLSLLQVGDLLSTLLLLSRGGTEANPVSAWLLGFGTPAFVAAKLVMALTLAAFVPVLERQRKDAAGTAVTWTTLGIDVVYGITVFTNVAQVLIFA